MHVVHFKTVLGGFFLTCSLFYLCIMYRYQSMDTTDSFHHTHDKVPVARKLLNIRKVSNVSKWKARISKMVTIPENRARFIMLEGRRISDQLGIVYWTLINHAYLDLTLNWLCQTSNMAGIHERVFIITTDEVTASELRHSWPLISVLSLQVDHFNSSLTWGEQQYSDFLVLRAGVLRLFVQNDVRFVLFETDSIWLRNPLHYFRNFTSFDITLPRKHQVDTRGRDLSFDPMIVNPNSRTKSLLHELYKMLMKPHSNGSVYDQDIIDDLCKARFANVQCKIFPWKEVADGKWFRLSEQKRRTLQTYIVNNNYYSGINNKITRQALNDLWYLTTEKQCNHEKVAKREQNELGVT